MQTLTQNIWPGAIPGAKTDGSYREETRVADSMPFVAQVTNPELLVYLPPKDKATGTAIIIIPGGGYAFLSMMHEGYDIAAWLNGLGVAGIVLKHRLPSDRIMENKSVGPLQDAQEAIRIVRRNAEKWNIRPDRIGIMGFSAGGHLAATASTMYNEKCYEPTDSTSARPDFSVLVYGALSMRKGIAGELSRTNLLGANAPQELVDKFSNELHVTPETPPAFLVHSADDGAVNIQNTILYHDALVKNKVPAEMHIYQSGGHGYGRATWHRGTEREWPQALAKWMKAQGFLDTVVAESYEGKRRAIVEGLLQGVKVDRDIQYNTTGRPLHLDVYYPTKASDKPLPCVVWIHGGALTDPVLNKDYDIVRWGVARTVQNGFVSVSVDYRLMIEASLPACIQDCQTAIRFLKANAARFNIDPNRMAVAGESAGGYLAGLCAFAPDADAFTTSDWNQVSSKVACGVLWYPAITHPPYNVDEYIAPKSIPVLSIHGDSDRLVSVNCSKTIEKVCKAKENPFQLVTLKGADHGFFPDLSNPDGDFDGYRKYMEKANELTIEFLKKHLQ